LNPAGDRDNRQVDREARGVRVEKKSRPHGKPVAAIVWHDRGDEESGWSVGRWTGHHSV
jgi:hypothetical protein